MDGGEERRAYGPRRSEKRRAEEDLEFMREASSRHQTVLARRKAVTEEARRLQEQAEHEVRVAVAARRLSQEPRQQQQAVEQRQQQPSVQSRHPVEDGSGSDSQSDWEIGEADDADVVYAWERFDDRGRSLDQTPVTGGPPLQAPIAMYPLGGSARAPLSSCPYVDFPLSPLPCGPKALADTPSLSAEGNSSEQIS